MRLISSTVAAGPIPPRMPIVLVSASMSDRPPY
jgi:hypothetical protein